MKKLNSRGFTLIELAIVLVIIGIIIAAVLKGQDLIGGARGKKLTTHLKEWQVAVFAFMDRYGRFPGDRGKDGIIGNVGGEQASGTSAIGEIVLGPGGVGGIATAPLNPVLIGTSYWVYIGYDGSVPVTGITPKNVIVVCANAACNVNFSPDQIDILQSVDTAIDGEADAGRGQFRAATAVTVTTLTAQDGRANAVVTDVEAVDETAAGTATRWHAVSPPRAAVWMFDRPY